MVTVCKWDKITVERTEDGKWISKAWAMRGPTGCMMDKEIPNPYAKKIESEYQQTLSKKDKDPNASFVILGTKVDGSDIMKPAEDNVEVKPKRIKEAAKNKEPKPKKESKSKEAAPIKNSASSMIGGFNPFSKV